MERSFSTSRLNELSIHYPNMLPPDFDFEGWLANHYNIMYVEGDDIGLLTFEYPGLYNAHWFFKSRGKDALDTAFSMLNDVFTNHGAKAIRGLTPVHLRGARYLAKRLGFVSVGILDFVDGPHDVMCLTLNDFNEKQEQRNG